MDKYSNLDKYRNSIYFGFSNLMEYRFLKEFPYNIFNFFGIFPISLLTSTQHRSYLSSYMLVGLKVYPFCLPSQRVSSKIHWYFTLFLPFFLSLISLCFYFWYFLPSTAFVFRLLLLFQILFKRCQAFSLELLSRNLSVYVVQKWENRHLINS